MFDIRYYNNRLVSRVKTPIIVLSLCIYVKGQDYETKKRLTVKDFNCKIYIDYKRVEVFGEYAKRQTTRNST